MTIYYLINAFPAAFVGLLGIWAAVVRRHWFLRFVVVCVFLLAGLLIPAYEVVIQSGFAIVLIQVGVWFARGKQREPVRFSLETALLAMAVVAVGSAVFAKAPEFDLVAWLDILSTGGAVALVSLLCLWVVFGRSRLVFRIVGGLLGLLVFMTLFYFSTALGAMFSYPGWSNYSVEDYWQEAIDPEILSWGLSYCIPTSLLGFTALCFGLFLARSSRWFTISGEGQSKRLNRGKQIARCSLVVFIFLLMSPTVYLLYRLAAPTPYPVVEMPDENGWDDLVAAGKLLDDGFAQVLSGCDTMPLVQLREEREKISEVFKLIDRASQRPNFQVRHPIEQERQIDDDFRSARMNIYKVQQAFGFQLAYLQRIGTPKEQVEVALQILHFGACFSHDTSLEYGVDAYCDRIAQDHLLEVLPKLDQQSVQKLLKYLIAREARRTPLENRLRYQRLQETHQGWQVHLNLLLDEWSGRDPAQGYRQQYLKRVIRFQIFIAQVALQRYFLEHQQLPSTLEEIVPDYLPELPLNPYTGSPVVYQDLGDGYIFVCSLGFRVKPLFVTSPAPSDLTRCLQAAWIDFGTIWMQ